MAWHQPQTSVSSSAPSSPAASTTDHAGTGYTLTEQGKTLFETLVQLDARAADWRLRQPS
ncbi:hypothetical protein AB0M80_03755 [Amycolatopsis sp. NPDC051045]|uniref:hypothetical protein n=1 Tax=Amycolatopsis sp. NPDC051045 TaxID=3156922 RepID=UPI0034318F45